MYIASCTRIKSETNQKLFQSILSFGNIFFHPLHRQIDIFLFHVRPRTRLQARRLLEQNLLNYPDKGTFAPGCRKDSVPDCHEVVKGKKYTTTAGIICIVRPCLIRLSLHEVRMINHLNFPYSDSDNFQSFTAESNTQLFLSLVDTFGSNPSPDVLQVVCADVACSLHPFIDDPKKKAKDEVFENYSKLSYVLGEKLVSNCCILNLFLPLQILSMGISM